MNGRLKRCDSTVQFGFIISIGIPFGGCGFFLIMPSSFGLDPLFIIYLK